jgi:signal transduction histidine kinase
VARPWRLRHKLLLGLALVVAIIATLLAGTVQGLTSYITTMKTTDSKLSELQLAEDLRESVVRLVVTDPHQIPAGGEAEYMRQQLEQTRQNLDRYVKQLDDTVRRQRDPDEGYQEGVLIADFREALDRFERALKEAGGITQVNEKSNSLADDKAIRSAHEKLALISYELRKAIYDDMYRRIGIAKTHHRHSMIIVLTCSGAAVLLVAGLLYFFYGWVFYPVRRLQEGVQHVAQGKFDQPIVLRSGDELEELARAFNDMSARVQATYTDLARQVNERSRQLVRSERLVSVGFLAAGVAHEINNPLASIAFCAEALQGRLRDVLARYPHETETVPKYLSMIQSEAFRCKEITQKLLEFSRVGERRREPAELVELVQAVLEIAQLLQNCRGKQIVFQPYHRVTALVNAPDIKSVVLNLVVNALDSMDEGGILTITLQQRGPMAELVFRDLGCGMTPDVLENIFEPFFTRSRTGKGTGLGLFISHQIISQHDGVIEVQSGGPGQGSTFTVRLPLQPAASAPVAEMGPFGAWAGGHEQLRPAA